MPKELRNINVCTTTKVLENIDGQSPIGIIVPGGEMAKRHKIYHLIYLVCGEVQRTSWKNQ